MHQCIVLKFSLLWSLDDFVERSNLARAFDVNYFVEWYKGVRTFEC